MNLLSFFFNLQFYSLTFSAFFPKLCPKHERDLFSDNHFLFPKFYIQLLNFTMWSFLRDFLPLAFFLKVFVVVVVKVVWISAVSASPRLFTIDGEWECIRAREAGWKYFVLGFFLKLRICIWVNNSCKKRISDISSGNSDKNLHLHLQRFFNYYLLLVPYNANIFLSDWVMFAFLCVCCVFVGFMGTALSFLFRIFFQFLWFSSFCFSSWCRIRLFHPQ